MILIDARRGSRRVGEKKAAERRQQWQEAKKAAAIAWQEVLTAAKSLSRADACLFYYHSIIGESAPSGRCPVPGGSGPLCRVPSGP